MVDKDYCENPKCDNPNEEREGEDVMIRWATRLEPAEYAFYCSSCLARAEEEEKRFSDNEQ